MAIARDATTGVTGMGAPATSYTFSHTCTGSNLMLFVGIFVSIDPASDIVSGVTYNGVSMTRTPNGYAAAPANNSTWLYYLANPATGANNIVISFSGTRNGSAGAVSYTGCSSTLDASAKNTAGPSASTCTATLTTVADNAWLVGVARADGGTRSFSAGMTAIGSEGFQTQMADSNGAKTPAGSYGMTYNATNSSFGLCLASIAPYVESSTGHQKNILTLGCG